MLGAHPDLLVGAARRSAERGDFERAVERYEAALAANPLLIPVYGELASLAGRRGEVERISQVIERGRHEGPRFAAGLAEFEALAYERAGDLELARAALEVSERASLAESSKTPLIRAPSNLNS